MKTNKRILSISLLLVLIVSLFSAPLALASGEDKTIAEYNGSFFVGKVWLNRQTTISQVMVVAMDQAVENGGPVPVIMIVYNRANGVALFDLSTAFLVNFSNTTNIVKNWSTGDALAGIADFRVEKGIVDSVVPTQSDREIANAIRTALMGVEDLYGKILPALQPPEASDEVNVTEAIINILEDKWLTTWEGAKVAADTITENSCRLVITVRSARLTLTVRGGGSANAEDFDAVNDVRDALAGVVNLYEKIKFPVDTEDPDETAVSNPFAAIAAILAAAPSENAIDITDAVVDVLKAENKWKDAWKDVTFAADDIIEGSSYTLFITLNAANTTFKVTSGGIISGDDQKTLEAVRAALANVENLYGRIAPTIEKALTSEDEDFVPPTEVDVTETVVEILKDAWQDAWEDVTFTADTIAKDSFRLVMKLNAANAMLNVRRGADPNSAINDLRRAQEIRDQLGRFGSLGSSIGDYLYERLYLKISEKLTSEDEDFTPPTEVDVTEEVTKLLKDWVTLYKYDEDNKLELDDDGNPIPLFYAWKDEWKDAKFIANTFNKAIAARPESEDGTRPATSMIDANFNLVIKVNLADESLKVNANSEIIVRAIRSALDEIVNSGTVDVYGAINPKASASGRPAIITEKVVEILQKFPTELDDEDNPVKFAWKEIWQGAAFSAVNIIDDTSFDLIIKVNEADSSSQPLPILSKKAQEKVIVQQIVDIIRDHFPSNYVYEKVSAAFSSPLPSSLVVTQIFKDDILSSYWSNSWKDVVFTADSITTESFRLVIDLNGSNDNISFSVRDQRILDEILAELNKVENLYDKLAEQNAIEIKDVTQEVKTILGTSWKEDFEGAVITVDYIGYLFDGDGMTEGVQLFVAFNNAYVFYNVYKPGTGPDYQVIAKALKNAIEEHNDNLYGQLESYATGDDAKPAVYDALISFWNEDWDDATITVGDITETDTEKQINLIITLHGYQEFALLTYKNEEQEQNGAIIGALEIFAEDFATRTTLTPSGSDNIDGVTPTNVEVDVDWLSAATDIPMRIYWGADSDKATIQYIINDNSTDKPSADDSRWEDLNLTQDQGFAEAVVEVEGPLNVDYALWLKVEAQDGTIRYYQFVIKLWIKS